MSKKKFKNIAILLIFIIFICGCINIFIDAFKEKEEEQKIDKDKIATKSDYLVVRDNNKYTLKTSKLKDKKLSKLFYDDKNIYLYYDGKDDATLIKYNVKTSRVVILYENDSSIHNGFDKIGNYYRLGNKLFDDNFKEIGDFPPLLDGSLLLPDLKSSLVEQDGNLVIKDIDSDNYKVVLEKKEDEFYTPYFVRSDGEYILVLKSVNDKKYLVLLDKTYNIINNIDITDYGDDTYSLLDDVPYLLIKDVKDQDTEYRIINPRLMSLVYDSSTDKDFSNFIFYNTKYVCMDKDNRVIFTDYVTKENRVLINGVKKGSVVNNFLMSSDNFSLVLTLSNDDMSFYVFYL